MGNGMNKVLPGLYVGNYRDSKDPQQLEKHHITHILAIHDTARKLHPDKHYLCVMASDSPDQNLTQYFALCNDFIHAARLREGNVLIHCLAGMSRSVTVAVAYIMSVTNLNWRDALKVVRAGRAVANPNLGFQKQLQDFEASKLIDERKRIKERYPSLALVQQDEEQCSMMLHNYEKMLSTRDICEGRCSLGEKCPAGVCRMTTIKKTKRQNSCSGKNSKLRSQSETSVTISNTSLNVVRPKSGPPAIPSRTSSAPSSRSGSRWDLSTGFHKSGTLTAPSSPCSTPPVSPIRSRNRRKISSPGTLQEVPGS